MALKNTVKAPSNAQATAEIRMPKKSPEDFSNSLAHDPDAIGIYVSVQKGAHEQEQYFVADDCCEEVGRVLGTLINMVSIAGSDVSAKDAAKARAASPDVLSMKKKWREVIRG